jgi:List-Bact-rpt repeat protein
MPGATPHRLARLLGVVIALLLFGAVAFTPKGQAQTSDSTLTVNVPRGGTVTSTPAGISCPPTCNASFDNGTQVTITASAEDGFAFLKWEGDCIGQS